ncbi:hypothetical protein ACSD7O_24875 [Methylorubrum extorquens]
MLKIIDTNTSKAAFAKPSERGYNRVNRLSAAYQTIRFKAVEI